jgi:hypothetical protein
MYVFQSAGQLSIEQFYVPFGGKLDPGNRWVVLAGVIPWEPLENQYAPLLMLRQVPLPSRSGWLLVRCTSSNDWVSQIGRQWS